MDMAILGSDGGGGGSNVDGITGGVPGVVGRAEGATLGISPVEGTAGAGALMSAGISTGCGSSGCSSPTGALALHHKLSYSFIC